jgi:hypothetical protein
VYGRRRSRPIQAGYGKTTLLSQWAERDGLAFAWVSVDEADNDAKVLLSYVAEALDAVGPIGERVFGALASPGRPVPGSVVHRLGSASSSMTSPVVLVLDDVQGDTAFGQQFLDIPVGQPVPQVPADASEITSGGNRKPANTEAVRCAITGPVSSHPRSTNATVPATALRADPDPGKTGGRNPEGFVGIIPASSRDGVSVLDAGGGAAGLSAHQRFSMGRQRPDDEDVQRDDHE